jgi:predicted membrane protein
MIYLACIFISPLALLLVGKPFQAIINAVFYIAALVLLITIVLFIPFGIGAWGIGVLHAILAVNSHKADKRNEKVIDAMRKG